MIEGALILLLGVAIGGGAVFLYVRRPPPRPEDKYARYRNSEGLLTSRPQTVTRGREGP